MAGFMSPAAFGGVFGPIMVVLLVLEGISDVFWVGVVGVEVEAEAPGEVLLLGLRSELDIFAPEVGDVAEQRGTMA